jgi:ATP-dependent DNA helicase RecG
MNRNTLEEFLNLSIRRYEEIGSKTLEKIIEVIGGNEIGRVLLYLPKKYILYKEISISYNLEKELNDNFIPVIYGKTIGSFLRNNGIFYRVKDLKSNNIFLVYFKKIKRGQRKPKLNENYYFIGKIKMEISFTNKKNQESNVIMFFPQFKEKKCGFLKPVYGKLSNYYENAFREILKNILYEMSHFYVFKKEEFNLNTYSIKSIFSFLHVINMKEEFSLNFLIEKVKEHKNILRLVEYSCFFLKLFSIQNIKIGTSKPQKYLCELKDITLTKCQINSIRGISNNLSKNIKTINFLQGDVGTGKTLVAFITIRKTLINGYNACFMSPTGILTNQHFKNFQKYFPDVSTFLLESGYKNKEYLNSFRDVLNSQIPTIFFGTHNLLYEQIPNIQYIVIDEQHKFGMEQRKILMDFYETADILFLSATPIPRTLFMLQNKQMDLFTLNTNPFERKVKTTIVKCREEVLTKIKTVSENSKVLWINGAIEENDFRKGVKATYDFLQSIQNDLNSIVKKTKESENYKLCKYMYFLNYFLILLIHILFLYFDQNYYMHLLLI